MSEADSSPWTDGHWQSEDGLRLHYRDYPARNEGPGRNHRPPVLCLPGLTRNARDFEDLAASLAGEWRVICPDMRGRGDSAYARNWATYQPMQYVADVRELLKGLGIERVVAIGTSLGGLMTMVMAATTPGMIAGALLNDIGPVIEEAGLARIRDYVGQGRSFPTWMHAARALEETQASAYPDYQMGEWLRLARRLMTLGGNGRIVFDYDMKIAEPFNQDGAAPQVDLWPALAALAGRPLLLLRGDLSDVLSDETFARMGEVLPEAETLSVARVGHAPTLDEPEVREAVARLLAKVA